MNMTGVLIIEDLKGAAEELREKDILCYIDGIAGLEAHRIERVLSGALELTNNYFLRRGIEYYLTRFVS